MSRPHPDTARAFGRAPRAARLAKGLSQEELAEAAERDRTTPSLYECGSRTPTLATLINIGRAVDIEPVQVVSNMLEKLRDSAS